MRKLPEGVRMRKSGLLEKRFSVNGCRYSVYGRSTRQLKQREQEKRTRLLGAPRVQTGTVTTDQYFETWIEGKKLSVKPSTIRVYTSYYRPYISPIIGCLPLEQITRRHILRIQSEASNHLSPATNNILLQVVKILLNEAVEDGLIPQTPAKGIKPAKSVQKASETYHRALTPEEQKQFMNAAKGNFYYELLAFQLLTGMRLGEVGALYWSDIDLEKQLIHVRRTITRTEDGVFFIGDSPKSQAGLRDIPINAALSDLLDRQRGRQLLRKPGFRQLCFPSPTGQMISHGSVNQNIRRILSQLDSQGISIPPFTSHALRDTFATRYIEQGGNPQTLKTILGHSSFSVTMDLYSQVLPNTKKQEMERIIIEI